MLAYMFPEYIDDIKTILPFLKKDNRGKFDYLIERLLYFYLQISDVIASGEILNKSLVEFVDFYTNNSLEDDDSLNSVPYFSLKVDVDKYRTFVKTATQEIIHINSFIRSALKDKHIDNTRLLLKLPSGIIFTNLTFSMDDMTVGEFRHNEDEVDVFGLDYVGIMFDYKIVENQIEITEFYFPIPTSDDAPLEYYFDDEIDLSSLNSEEIYGKVENFVSRKTLNRLKSSHSKIKEILQEYFDDSLYLNVLDIRNNNYPDMYDGTKLGDS